MGIKLLYKLFGLLTVKNFYLHPFFTLKLSVKIKTTKKPIVILNISKTVIQIAKLFKTVIHQAVLYKFYCYCSLLLYKSYITVIYFLKLQT